MGAHAHSFAPPRASGTTRVARILLVAALIPVALLYLLPRIVDLVATPYRLDQAVVHADRYNPALHKVVDHEENTLATFDALDRVKVALADVRGTNAEVKAELRELIAQIAGDLQYTLDTADGNVVGLLTSLDRLTGRLNALHGPVDGAAGAVTADRSSLEAILAEARRTAAKVHAARRSAETSASNVSGE